MTAGEVGHGTREAAAGAIREVAREPVPPLRIARDDDLVGVEDAQRILDREQRVRIADPAVGVETRRAKRDERHLEPFVRRPARPVHVGDPVREPAVQRGDDDDDDGGRQLLEPCRADRLVRD